MKAALSVRSAPWGGWQLSTVPVCPLTVTGVQTCSAASDARLELKFALFLCGRGSQRAVRCPTWSGIWTAVGPDGMEHRAALWGGFEALLSTHGESSFEFRGTCLLKPGAFSLNLALLFWRNNGCIIKRVFAGRQRTRTHVDCLTFFVLKPFEADSHYEPICYLCGDYDGSTGKPACLTTLIVLFFLSSWNLDA